jgi:hypothetical protein
MSRSGVHWRATADENGHYVLAVPLSRRDLPHAPIRKFSTPCDIALHWISRLRLVYGVDAIENLAQITCGWRIRKFLI